MDIFEMALAAKKRGGGLTELPEGYPYKESAEVTVFEENRLSGASYPEGFPVFMGVPALVAPVEGATYKVSIYEAGAHDDDTVWGELREEYEAVCYKSVSGMLVIGDENLSDPSFAFMYDVDSGEFNIANINNVGVKITGVTETIQPMAEEFMPMLTSPNGTKYKLAVSDDGALSAVAVS